MFLLVKQGKLQTTETFDLWVSQFEGKTVRVELKLSSNDRTTSQNRLLWKYYEILSAETGDDPNSLHEFFKRKFLPPRFVKTKWGEMKVPGSTTKLSKIEFGEYLDRICALTGVPIWSTQ